MGLYLVTGVAGFIASKVAEFLLDAGHAVVGVDNLNDAYDVRLKQWRLARLDGRAGFTFRQLDICDRDGVAALFQSTIENPKSKIGAVQFDAVINLAARAGVRQSVENPWVYVDTNVTGTLNLLDLCHMHGVGKFVLASTSSLYGKHNTMPYSEDQDTSRPLSPYAASKKGAEALCYTYHYLHGLDVTVFRYFTVYGPAGRPDMSLFRFTQWIFEERPVHIYGDGTQQRDFTYVDDIARGTIAGLQPMGYEIINLGSDAPVPLMDTVRLIEDLTGKQARLEFHPFPKADVYATWADISKAERLLGWRPQITYRAGIAALVEWYQVNREWAREIVTLVG
ncbi:MAG TPA: GDP-mannose 4,6-dehydratase [Anaerolineae bacterium]|nr:GDP-mannose 4,6-dehydratase [Anaerolineae bacterium]